LEELRLLTNAEMDAESPLALLLAAKKAAAELNRD
jgi:hypothetical protein